MRIGTGTADRSWVGYGAAVLLLHVLGITGLLLVTGDHPELWSMGLLAYTLGLRHAFDVDHIAAIDNTVRKLLQEQKSPLGVGFYFSLGHSSVVFLMVLALALSVQWAQANMPWFQEIGGVIGITVSGSFLLILGLINLIILFQLLRQFRKRRGGELDAEQLLVGGGFFTRLAAPLFKFIGRSWHVYPLGFLFGLGFDTATEISLLAMSAGAAKSTLPVFGILSFPFLFAAGMSLMDTADGMFMTHAYKWAFSNPIRKLYYNLTVTAVAVVAALLIGMTELAQVVSGHLGLEGPFWSKLGELDFGMLGYLLVGLFVVAWAASYGIWRLFKIEERWQSIDA